MIVDHLPKPLTKELPQEDKIPSSTLGIPSPWFEDTPLDLEWLAEQPMLPFLVPLISPISLQKSLISEGLENHLEIVACLRGKSLQKILDHDIWSYSDEIQCEDISFEKAFDWVRSWLLISPEFAAERFFDLEDETICLMLSKFFEIMPEGIAHITEDIRENWLLTPDNRFFLNVKHQEEDSFFPLKQFVDSLYAKDIRLAGSLFAYASMLVRQETLQDGLRWRQSRLLDQGFVTREEALRRLAPKGEDAILKTLQELKTIQSKRSELIKKYPSLLNPIQDFDLREEIQDQVEETILLLNSLDVEVGAGFLTAALGAEKIQQLIGHPSGKAENFYDDPDFLHDASEQVVILCQNILNQWQSIKINSHQKGNRKELIIEQALHKIATTTENKNILNLFKQQLSNLANCISQIHTEAQRKGAKLQNALLITRGALNLGLEICLLKGASCQEKDTQINEDAQINKAIVLLNEIGIDALFQIGWQRLLSLPLALCNQLIEWDETPSHPLDKKLNTKRKIHLKNDNEIIEISIKKLYEKLRFSDMRKWHEELHGQISNELFIALEAFLTGIPQFPILLNQAGIQISPDIKPFEYLDELKKAELFVQNFALNETHGS